MSISEVPVLPLRAGRHLATWIVWHTVRVSLVEDEDGPSTTLAVGRKRRGKK